MLPGAVADLALRPRLPQRLERIAEARPRPQRLQDLLHRAAVVGAVQRRNILAVDGMGIGGDQQGIFGPRRLGRLHPRRQQPGPERHLARRHRAEPAVLVQHAFGAIGQEQPVVATDQHPARRRHRHRLRIRHGGIRRHLWLQGGGRQGGLGALLQDHRLGGLTAGKQARRMPDLCQKRDLRGRQLGIALDVDAQRMHFGPPGRGQHRQHIGLVLRPAGEQRRIGPQPHVIERLDPVMRGDMAVIQHEFCALVIGADRLDHRAADPRRDRLQHLHHHIGDHQIGRDRGQPRPVGRHGHPEEFQAAVHPRPQIALMMRPVIARPPVGGKERGPVQRADQMVLGIEQQIERRLQLPRHLQLQRLLGQIAVGGTARGQTEIPGIAALDLRGEALEFRADQAVEQALPLGWIPAVVQEQDAVHQLRIEKPLQAAGQQRAKLGLGLVEHADDGKAHIRICPQARGPGGPAHMLSFTPLWFSRSPITAPTRAVSKGSPRKSYSGRRASGRPA